MHNVEFKAELRDVELARSLLKTIKATFVDTLEQTDTYFRLADGRLKKRETKGQATEWIFYHRSDEAKARISTFTIYSEAQALLQFGMTPLPVWVKVSKVRELYLHSGVRIHVDMVEGLGRFVELEALVSPRQNLAKCYELVGLLKRALSPAMGEIVSQSYSDMVEVMGA